MTISDLPAKAGKPFEFWAGSFDFGHAGTPRDHRGHHLCGDRGRPLPDHQIQRRDTRAGWLIIMVCTLLISLVCFLIRFLR